MHHRIQRTVPPYSLYNGGKYEICVLCNDFLWLSVTLYWFDDFFTIVCIHIVPNTSCVYWSYCDIVSHFFIFFHLIGLLAFWSVCWLFCGIVPHFVTFLCIVWFFGILDIVCIGIVGHFVPVVCWLLWEHSVRPTPLLKGSFARGESPHQIYNAGPPIWYPSSWWWWERW